MANSKLDALVVAARAAFTRLELSTEFATGSEVVLWRSDSLADRYVELLIRPQQWVISYVHLPTKKAIRCSGDDAHILMAQITKLCSKASFEPAEADPAFIKFGPDATPFTITRNVRNEEA